MPTSANDLQRKKVEARILLVGARSGDSIGNKVKGRLKWCVWGIPKSHTTRNISEICDECWKKEIANHT